MNRILWAVLSMLMPGMSQLIHCDWAKGMAFFVGAMVASAMLRRQTVLSSAFADGSATHVGLLGAIMALALWSAVDAYRSASAAPTVR